MFFQKWLSEKSPFPSTVKGTRDDTEIIRLKRKDLHPRRWLTNHPHPIFFHRKWSWWPLWEELRKTLAVRRRGKWDRKKKKLGLEYKIRKETKSRQRAEKIKMFLRGQGHQQLNQEPVLCTPTWANNQSHTAGIRSHGFSSPNYQESHQILPNFLKGHAITVN